MHQKLRYSSASLCKRLCTSFTNTTTRLTGRSWSRSSKVKISLSHGPKTRPACQLRRLQTWKRRVLILKTTRKSTTFSSTPPTWIVPWTSSKLEFVQTIPPYPWICTEFLAAVAFRLSSLKLKSASKHTTVLSTNVPTTQIGRERSGWTSVVLFLTSL